MIKKVLLLLCACALVTASGVALALPATSPDGTLGTDGKVRALLQVGNVMWVGGQFSATSDGVGGLSNIVGLDVATGQRAASVIDVTQLTGSDSIVYDLSTDGTNVYAAGTFSATNGAINLVACDAVSGTLTQKFTSVPALKSVLYDNGRVLDGGAKLQAWLPTGAKDPSWEVTTLDTVAEYRPGHVTAPAYRDIKPYNGGYFAACQCDSLTQGGSTYTTKAIVRLSVDGSCDPTWAPSDSESTSAAFGIDLFVDTDGVVLTAGGSDFTSKYSLTNGLKLWKTDTNGSSQAVTRYRDASGSNYIIGGHFRCLSDTATGGSQLDYFEPRLSALGLDGVVDKSWVVPVRPTYQGVWVTYQDTFGKPLWIGGEFKQVGGQWTSNNCDSGKATATNQVARAYLARFSTPA